MKTKNFGEFLNEDLDIQDDENPIWDYERILDVIQSNSSEDAAKIIADIIHDICRYR